MPDIIGSVRRSIVFKPSGEDPAGFGGFVEKIGSSIRKYRIGIFAKAPAHVTPVEEEPLPPMEGNCTDEPPVIRDRDGVVPKSNSAKEEELKKEEDVPLPPLIRWRKGELIGCGTFGRVYMGMNLDSGELLAVKEVSIISHSSSKETQEYTGELEKEVNLLKNLSHPNIVRYLGTDRVDDSLNILLEFVPGGSISSLLKKFKAFPESVIRMYTKQILLGLEYLHKNKIMHRDIKGANILVDNKGCIKLADFGASKKVDPLATIPGAKSLKGTPYWMAPEVIDQSGHSYSADIWSLGCTVIEMATAKDPWNAQYQDKDIFAVLYNIGSTKSHPPIPDHLSIEAKDFLSKCLQKEPDLRQPAAELLKHPFVTEISQKSHTVLRSSLVEGSEKRMGALGVEIKKSMSLETRSSCKGINDFTIHPDHLSEQGSLWEPVNFDDDNDMCQIDDNDDEEETESKIRAFLDEKALELKKLQSPLYEFYNSFNGGRRLSTAIDAEYTSSPVRRVSNIGNINNRDYEDVMEQEPLTPRFAERERKWKEELNEELERTRELMRASASKTSSPKDRILIQQRDRSRFASPRK